MSWMRIKASSVSRGCRSVSLRSESSTAVPQVTFEYVHSEGVPPIVAAVARDNTGPDAEHRILLRLSMMSGTTGHLYI